MTKKELQQIERVNKIQALASKIVERVTGVRGGSCCMVPSSRPGHMAYRVDIDENYNPTHCPCKSFKYSRSCAHCEAVVLYYAPRIALLLSKKNFVCVFYRSGELVKARVSQLSKSERTALRQQLAGERRAAYAALYNPCLVA